MDPDLLSDYIIHFLVEALGGVIAMVAYRTHVCRHWWHKALIWTVLTAITSILTVHAAG